MLQNFKQMMLLKVVTEATEDTNCRAYLFFTYGFRGKNIILAAKKKKKNRCRWITSLTISKY